MENHVFDCNSIVSYHMSAVRLLDTGMEAGSEWEKCLREIEGLYGQIPGDLRSPLLGDSLAGFTYPLCRPEWEMVREELDHTLENLETYIPLADREGSQETIGFLRIFGDFLCEPKVTRRRQDQPIHPPTPR